MVLRWSGFNTDLKCLGKVGLSKSYVGLFVAGKTSDGNVHSTPGSVTVEFREKLVMAIELFSYRQ